MNRHLGNSDYNLPSKWDDGSASMPKPIRPSFREEVWSCLEVLAALAFFALFVYSSVEGQRLAMEAGVL